MANEKNIKEENERVKKWFKENEKYFTISIWEDEIGAPRGTLRKFTKGERGLTSQWIEPLKELIKKIEF